MASDRFLSTGMSSVVGYVLLPSLAPLAIVGLYYTPVSVIGCANRGLLALAVVLISLIAGITIGLFGIRAKRRGQAGTHWRLVAMLILTVPALLVLGPLG